MKKRTFTQEEKLRIVKEASENGIKATLEKYGIYAASYYSWKRKLDQMGEAGLQHGMTPEHLKRIRQLEKENALLKQLLAEKELEGRLKSELLKKQYALEKNFDSPLHPSHLERTRMQPVATEFHFHLSSSKSCACNLKREEIS